MDMVVRILDHGLTPFVFAGLVLFGLVLPITRKGSKADRSGGQR